MSFALLQSTNSSIRIFSHRSRLTRGRVVQSRNTENYRDERLTRRIFALNISYYYSQKTVHITLCVWNVATVNIYSTYAVLMNLNCTQNIWKWRNFWNGFVVIAFCALHHCFHCNRNVYGFQTDYKLHRAIEIVMVTIGDCGFFDYARAHPPMKLVFFFFFAVWKTVNFAWQLRDHLMLTMQRYLKYDAHLIKIAWIAKKILLILPNSTHFTGFLEII